MAVNVDRRLPVRQARAAAHHRGRRRGDHQRRLDVGHRRQLEPGRLRRLEARAGRPDASSSRSTTRRTGVRANAICPGFIETERSLGFPTLNRGADWRARKLAEIPLGRFGRAEEVAALAAFLASDEAAILTGAVIPIDGGTAARRS